MKTEITQEFLQNLVGKTIKFNSLISNLDSYMEPNMKAKVLSYAYKIDMDDEYPLHAVTVDLSPFEESNHKLQDASFYDKVGQPLLTAVEAGYYRPQELIYLEPWIEDLSFEVVDKEEDKATELLHDCLLQLEYLNDKFGQTGTSNSLISRLKTFLPK